MSKKYAFQSFDRIGCKNISHFPSLFPNLKFYFLNSRHQVNHMAKAEPGGLYQSLKIIWSFLEKPILTRVVPMKFDKLRQCISSHYIIKSLFYWKEYPKSCHFFNIGLPHSFLKLKYWLTMISKTNVKILTVLWSGNFLLVIQHLSVLQWNWQSDPASSRTHTLRTELNTANCLTVGQIYSHR